MLRLLERNIASVEERLVLLAPPQAVVPPQFRNVTYDPVQHRALVRAMQRLRGSVYLAEGNVRHDQLSPEGLHETPEDARSWHLLMKDRHGRVSSCAWYLEHENTASIQSLRVRNCPLAHVDGWRDRLRIAVESELARARRDRLRYAEVGGWAVAKERRCTSEGLVLALAAYGLCRTLGGALGITTANVKHSSSSILRRLGGSYLEVLGSAIPAYHDARYNADIEILRFDSRRPAGKYAGLIELLTKRLANVSVYAGTATQYIPAGYRVADTRAHALVASGNVAHAC
jgi:hypothetical protein